MFVIAILPGILMIAPIAIIYHNLPQHNRDTLFQPVLIIILHVDQLIHLYGAYSLRMMEDDYSISSENWSTLSMLYLL